MLYQVFCVAQGVCCCSHQLGRISLALALQTPFHSADVLQRLLEFADAVRLAQHPGMNIQCQDAPAPLCASAAGNHRHRTPVPARTAPNAGCSSMMNRSSSSLDSGMADQVAVVGTKRVGHIVVHPVAEIVHAVGGEQFGCAFALVACRTDPAAYRLAAQFAQAGQGALYQFLLRIPIHAAVVQASIFQPWQRISSPRAELRSSR